MKKLLVLGALVVSIYTGAQPIDPWLADGINRSIQQNRNIDGYRSGGFVNWEAGEIRRLRRMRFYGAIAMSPDNPNALTWRGGDPNEEISRSKALKACPKSNCRVVASFSNTCAMVAMPDGAKDIDDIFVGIDKSPEVAIDNAYRSCEKKFGKGACHYLVREKTAKYSAFCVGYDYGVYSSN